MADILNHGQIGMNETPITSALGKGDFSTAEKLIQENTEPSYLNEGAFEAIPLALVLSSAIELRAFPRHLRLARLLVESGANPNLRISEEWQASPSPMECLWELYALTREQLLGVEDDRTERDGLVDPLFTIGLHDETELKLQQLEEQILELLDVFLVCGGDPNVTTTMANSTLYHVALGDMNVDEEVITKLSEAGGDLDHVNVHGTTALMTLIACCDGDKALHFLQRKPQVRTLHDMNCTYESALWRAMFSGSPGVALELLSRGASLSDRACVATSLWARLKPWNKVESMIMSSFGVSAILSPLLQDSAPYTRLMAACTGYAKAKPLPFHVSLLEKVISCAISPVVDNTPVSDCFPPKVLDEIRDLTTHETSFPFQSLLTSAIQPQDVALLMFGKLNAGLQQLCVNKILEYVLFTPGSRESRELMNALEQDPKILPEEDWKQASGVMALSSARIDRLVTELKLPPSLAPRFQVAAARLQLGATLYIFQSSPCLEGCDESDTGSWYSDYEDDDDDEYTTDCDSDVYIMVDEEEVDEEEEESLEEEEESVGEEEEYDEENSAGDE